MLSATWAPSAPAGENRSFRAARHPAAEPPPVEPRVPPIEIAPPTPPAGLEFPPAAGRLVEAYWPDLPATPDRPLIVHIQDAHDVYPAQKNESLLLAALAKQQAAPLLVAVEGASGPLPTEWLHVHPDRNFRDKLAEEFLRKSFLTGEEYLAVTAEDVRPVLVGVEDQGLHAANVAARDETTDLRRAAQDLVSGYAARAERLKPLLFPRELAALEELLGGLESGALNTVDGLKKLRALRRDLLPREEFPQITRLLDLADQEPRLDRTALTAELRALADTPALDLLLQAAPLARGDLHSQAAFYERLWQAALSVAPSGTAGRFPQILLHRDNARLSNLLDVSQLSEETLALGRRARETLLRELPAAEREPARSLASLSEWLDRRKVLLTLEVTPALWREHLLTRDEWSWAAATQALSEAETARGLTPGTALAAAEDEKTLAEASTAAERFYALAQRRNNALLDRTLAAARRLGASRVALVAGGFHTPALGALMRERGISYLVLQPQLTPAPDSARKASLLSQEPTLLKLDAHALAETLLASPDAFETTRRQWEEKLTPVDAKRLENVRWSPRPLALQGRRALLGRVDDVPAVFLAGQEGADNDMLTGPAAVQWLAAAAPAEGLSSDEARTLYDALKPGWRSRDRDVLRQTLGVPAPALQVFFQDLFQSTRAFFTVRRVALAVAMAADATIWLFIAAHLPHANPHQNLAMAGVMPSLTSVIYAIFGAGQASKADERRIQRDLNSGDEAALEALRQRLPKEPPDDLFREVQTYSDQRSAKLYLSLSDEKRREVLPRLHERTRERLFNGWRLIFFNQHIEEMREYRAIIRDLLAASKTEKMNDASLKRSKTSLQRALVILDEHRRRHLKGLFGQRNIISKDQYQEFEERFVAPLEVTGETCSTLESELNAAKSPGEAAAPLVKARPFLEKELERMDLEILKVRHPDVFHNAADLKRQVEWIEDGNIDAAISAELAAGKLARDAGMKQVYKSAHDVSNLFGHGYEDISAKVRLKQERRKTERSAPPTSSPALDKTAAQAADILEGTGDRRAVVSVSTTLAKEAFTERLAEKLMGRKKIVYLNFNRLFTALDREKMIERMKQSLLDLATVENVVVVMDMDAFLTEPPSTLDQILKAYMGIRGAPLPPLLALGTEQTIENRIQDVPRFKEAFRRDDPLNPQTDLHMNLQDDELERNLLLDQWKSLAGKQGHSMPPAGALKILADDLLASLRTRTPFDRPLLAVRVLETAHALAPPGTAVTKEQIMRAVKALPDVKDLPLELRFHARKSVMPKSVQEEGLSDLRAMSSASLEDRYSKSVRLEKVIRIPWEERSAPSAESEADEGARVAEELNLSHYGLGKAKDQIQDFVSQKRSQAKKARKILLFVGPPGVGKTTLGRAIAKVLKKKFVRKSLAGINDESAIKGHDKGYSNALEGLLAAGLLECGEKDPVFLLDEVDKSSVQDALLHALDSAKFTDETVGEIPVDEIFFILTANDITKLSPALWDRLEIVDLSGYAINEKMEIGVGYTIPELMENYSLTEGVEISLPDKAAFIRFLVENYTWEEGARQLSRHLKKIFRRALREYYMTGKTVVLTAEKIRDYLGPPTRQIIHLPDAPAVGETHLFHPDGGFESFSLSQNTAVSTAQGGTLSPEPLSAHESEDRLRVFNNQLRLASSLAKKDTPSFSGASSTSKIPAGKDGGLGTGLALYAGDVSAALNVPPPARTAFLGELTLAELRPVSDLRNRLRLAQESGVSQIVLPHLNGDQLLKDVFRFAPTLRGPVLDPARGILVLPALPVRQTVSPEDAAKTAWINGAVRSFKGSPPPKLSTPKLEDVGLVGIEPDVLVLSGEPRVLEAYFRGLDLPADTPRYICVKTPAESVELTFLGASRGKADWPAYKAALEEKKAAPAREKPSPLSVGRAVSSQWVLRVQQAFQGATGFLARAREAGLPELLQSSPLENIVKESPGDILYLYWRALLTSAIKAEAAGNQAEAAQLWAEADASFLRIAAADPLKAGVVFLKWVQDEKLQSDRLLILKKIPPSTWGWAFACLFQSVRQQNSAKVEKEQAQWSTMKEELNALGEGPLSVVKISPFVEKLLKSPLKTISPPADKRDIPPNQITLEAIQKRWDELPKDGTVSTWKINSFKEFLQVYIDQNQAQLEEYLDPPKDHPGPNINSKTNGQILWVSRILFPLMDEDPETRDKISPIWEGYQKNRHLMNISGPREPLQFHEPNETAPGTAVARVLSHVSALMARDIFHLAAVISPRDEDLKNFIPLLAGQLRKDGLPIRVHSLHMTNELSSKAKMASAEIGGIIHTAQAAKGCLLVINLKEFSAKFPRNEDRIQALGEILHQWQLHGEPLPIVFLTDPATHAEFAEMVPEYFAQVEPVALPDMGRSVEKKEEDLDHLFSRINPSDKSLTERQIATLPPAPRRKAEALFANLQKSSSTRSSERGALTVELETRLSFPYERRTPPPIEIGPGIDPIPQIRNRLLTTRKKFDEKYHGRKEIKEVLLDHLALDLHLAVKGKKRVGTILNLNGPSGGGKTVLAEIFAEAAGRKYAGVKLGGVKDVVKILGMRPTYKDSHEGALAAGLKKVGTKNPVMQLDEIDKMETTDRSDPYGALLPAFDPEQNASFPDAFIEDADLSEVLFISTTNDFQGFEEKAPALADRMESMDLPGYGLAEKIEIGVENLIPRVREELGLSEQDIRLLNLEETVRRVIQDHTDEEGVRGLIRQLTKIFVQADRERRRTKEASLEVSTDKALGYLGSGRLKDRSPQDWTLGECIGAMFNEGKGGGQIVYIQADLYDTGDASQEFQTESFSILSEDGPMEDSLKEAIDAVDRIYDFKRPGWKLDLNMTPGNMEKGGPSAAAALVASIASRASRRPVRQDVAVTGALSGDQLVPVEALAEKILAAQEKEMKGMVIPQGNKNVLLKEVFPLHPEQEGILIEKGRASFHLTAPEALKETRLQIQEAKEDITSLELALDADGGITVSFSEADMKAALQDPRLKGLLPRGMTFYLVDTTAELLKVLLGTPVDQTTPPPPPARAGTRGSANVASILAAIPLVMLLWALVPVIKTHPALSAALVLAAAAALPVILLWGSALKRGQEPRVSRWTERKPVFLPALMRHISSLRDPFLERQLKEVFGSLRSSAAPAPVLDPFLRGEIDESLSRGSPAPDAAFLRKSLGRATPVVSARTAVKEVLSLSRKPSGEENRPRPAYAFDIEDLGNPVIRQEIADRLAALPAADSEDEKSFPRFVCSFLGEGNAAQALEKALGPSADRVFILDREELKRSGSLSPDDKISPRTLEEHLGRRWEEAVKLRVLEDASHAGRRWIAEGLTLLLGESDRDVFLSEADVSRLKSLAAALYPSAPDADAMLASFKDAQGRYRLPAHKLRRLNDLDDSVIYSIQA